MIGRDHAFDVGDAVCLIGWTLLIELGTLCASWLKCTSRQATASISTCFFYGTMERPTLNTTLHDGITTWVVRLFGRLLIIACLRWASRGLVTGWIDANSIFSCEKMMSSQTLMHNFLAKRIVQGSSCSKIWSPNAWWEFVWFFIKPSKSIVFSTPPRGTTLYCKSLLSWWW